MVRSQVVRSKSRPQNPGVRHRRWRALRALLMVCRLGVRLVQLNRWMQRSEFEGGSRNKVWFNFLIFLGIGFYGGFIQAGVGIFLLAGLVLAAKYTLLQANGIKMLAVVVFSVPALFIFFSYQQVHLGYGLLMAVFQSLGALIGVRFVAKLPNANLWIHRLLILIVFVSALKMFGLLDLIIEWGSAYFSSSSR